MYGYRRTPAQQILPAEKLEKRFRVWSIDFAIAIDGALYSNMEMSTEYEGFQAG
jgi:hypothetical protein